MTPAIGVRYRRGREVREVTAVDDRYVYANCVGSLQRNRVICLLWQWDRWAARAERIGGAA